jgi:hypothetical protein
MKLNRIYTVSTGNTTRLVRASHRAQALAHVANTTINVAVASQDELVKHLAKGVSVESASDASTPDLFGLSVAEQAAAPESISA